MSSADGWTTAAENKPDLGSLGLNQYWYSRATIEALASAGGGADGDGWRRSRL